MDLFWALHGATAVEVVLLIVCCGLLLGAVPLGWLLIRRFAGHDAAGPIGLLILFEMVAVLYALFTPAWQMPDEPRHMEYVELVRRCPAGFFESGEQFLQRQCRFEQEVSETILESARAGNIERWLPGAAAIHQGVIPGPREITHPPLYYRLAALVVSPLGGAQVTARLALARTLGVVLTTWVVWACGAVIRTIWPDGSGARRAAMYVAMGIPTFTLWAGAVNNDVLANLLGSLLILLLVVGIVSRSRWTKFRYWLPAVALVAILGILTKRTVVAFLPLIAVALLLRIRSLRRALVVVNVAVLTLSILVLVVPAQRLALWETYTYDHRYRCPGGKIGQWAICFGDPFLGISQHIPVNRMPELAGWPITLGTWAKTAGEKDLLTVQLVMEGIVLGKKIVEVGRDWQFLTLTTQVPESLPTISVDLVSETRRPIRLDGVILIAGSYSQNPPEYRDENASEVVWDGRRVRNELANASAERASFMVPASFPRWAQLAVNTPIDAVDHVVLQPRRVVEALPAMPKRLTNTFGMFWATVGWQIPPPLLPRLLLALLAVLSIAGIAAAARVLFANQTGGPNKRGVALLVSAVLAGLVIVLLRDLPPRDPNVISGRYLFVAMPAFAATFSVGWRRLWRGEDRSYLRALGIGALVMHAFFLVLLLIPFVASGWSAVRP